MPNPPKTLPGTTSGSAAKLPIRRWLRVAHLWAGIGLGLWLVMLGITGSALVYQHSLRQVLERGRKIKPGLPRLAIDQLLARVHQQRPDFAVIDIDGLEYDDSALELLIRPATATAPEKRSRYLIVDPGTGEIGALQSSSSTFMGFIAQLHYNLMSGETGLAINAFAGGLAIFFAVTGLILWWRGKAKWKNGLRIKIKGASTRVRNYSIHSAIGFYSSLFLALAGLSGIYFAAPQPYLGAAARLSGTSLAVMKDFLDPPLSTSPRTLPDAPVNQIFALARAQYPNEVLSEIEIPQRPSDAWQFHFFSHGVIDLGNAELVAIDRRSAKVLAADRTADLPIAIRAVILLRPLHYGTIGGHVTRVLWIFLGLTPAVLLFTGFVIWRKRVNADAIAAQKAVKPSATLLQAGPN
jgi:uncharacterized iron-regulated membrane protein